MRERLPEWIATKVRPIIEPRSYETNCTHGWKWVAGTTTNCCCTATLEPGSGYVRTVVTLRFGARATGEPHQALPVACDMEGHVEGCFIRLLGP